MSLLKQLSAYSVPGKQIPKLTQTRPGATLPPGGRKAPTVSKLFRTQICSVSTVAPRMSPHLHFLLMVVDLPRDVDVHGAPLPWFLRRNQRKREANKCESRGRRSGGLGPPAPVSLHGVSGALSILERACLLASDAFRIPKVLL